MKGKVCISLACCMILWTQLLSGQDLSKPSQDVVAKPTRILFVGNSVTYYNSGVWHHVRQLAESESPPIDIQVAYVVASGTTLHMHWSRGKAQEEIRTGKYDVVVLQDSIVLTTVQDLKEYSGRFIDESKKVKARAILFMVWDTPKIPTWAWATMDIIAQANYDVAQARGGEVSPVGLAWQQSIKQRPEIGLYQSDNNHPTYAGTYLAACTLFCTIFQKSPVGLSYIDEIDANQADFLQKIAWETASRQAGR